MAVADHGWRLVRIAELLRTAEHHQDRALRVLHRVDPGMRPTVALTLKRTEIDRLRHEIAEIAEIAEQLEGLVEGVPEGPIPIVYDDVRVGAEQVLSHSTSADPAAVLLAARMLDRSTGLRALAEGLRTSDAHASWERTTVGALLASFRGVSPQLARRIATAAGLAPGTELAGCERGQIAQLADQLDLHVRG
jgi:hypothetical protein